MTLYRNKDAMPNRIMNVMCMISRLIGLGALGEERLGNGTRPGPIGWTGATGVRWHRPDRPDAAVSPLDRSAKEALAMNSLDWRDPSWFRAATLTEAPGRATAVALDAALADRAARRLERWRSQPPFRPVPTSRTASRPMGSARTTSSTSWARTPRWSAIAPRFQRIGSMDEPSPRAMPHGRSPSPRRRGREAVAGFLDAMEPLIQRQSSTGCGMALQGTSESACRAAVRSRSGRRPARRELAARVTRDDEPDFRPRDECGPSARPPGGRHGG